MATTPKTTADVLDEMRLRFTSGNSLPVERAHIRAFEWAIVTMELAGHRHAAYADRARDWSLATMHAFIVAICDELGVTAGPHDALAKIRKMREALEAQ